jgi:hypothetical protein
VRREQGSVDDGVGDVDEENDDDYAAVRALGEEYRSRVPRCLT